MASRQPVPVDAQPKFPFGVDFQKSLLRLLCVDSAFSHQIARMLHPQYFENEVLAWAFQAARNHQDTYGGIPSLNLLIDQARRIDPRLAQMYVGTLETVAQAPLKDEMWLRAEVTDFVKRNLFVEGFAQAKELYNAGKTTEAYDFMMERMENLQRTTWQIPDRGVFFREVGKRMVERHREDELGAAVSTGFPHIDAVLGGGLSAGEMGIWIAYAKGGKSTMLVNLGVASTKVAWKRTAHFVFEGSRKMVENRYEAAFMDDLYSNVKRGDIDEKKYARAVQEYNMLGDMLVIQGFTDEWDYSVVDVHDALKNLKSDLGFKPEMVIVDYGDLLRGREKTYRNETEKQKAAFRDLKSLANRGYAVWTASQAQRPSSDADVPHLIKSRQIADCYEKVRVADFLGSLNMSPDERRNQQMAIYCELYRDNAADHAFMVRADLARMRLYQVPKLESVHGADRCNVHLQPLHGKNGKNGNTPTTLKQIQAQI